MDCRALRLALAVGLVWLAGAEASAEAERTPDTVLIPAGPFIAGSDEAERQAAYRLDEQAYGHSVTRQQGWYDGERQRQTIELPAYRITLTPVTNGQYQAFLQASDHSWPSVSRQEWDSYGLVHPYERAQRHVWDSRTAPSGREDHPVVLVSYEDAEAYARWLSRTTGHSWRLPSELEWEKAARGTDGRRFPWGDDFDAERLNSHDQGPFDTTPAGSFARGASPYGVLDVAGQVFEWTAAPSGDGRHIVKGGSWDDKGCGVCRPAARHSRPDHLKHILIGFRLVRDERQ